MSPGRRVSAILKLGQELSLGKKYSSSRPAAVLADTVRPTVAGAGKHPGWDTARAIAERITTPLLPDDYLKLANPLWSARELRGRVLEVRRETVDSATLVIKPGWGFSFDYQPGQYIGIGAAGRRTLAVAVVLADVEPGAGAAGRDIGQRAPSPSRSRPCPRGSCRPTWSAGWRLARSCGWPRRRATS